MPLQSVEKRHRCATIYHVGAALIPHDQKKYGVTSLLQHCGIPIAA